MAAITRLQIEATTDARHSETRSKDQTKWFLTLFDGDQPLQDEAVTDWHEDAETYVSAAHIKLCLKDALAKKWVEERSGGLFLTEEGKKVAEEILPDKMF